MKSQSRKALDHLAELCSMHSEAAEHNKAPVLCELSTRTIADAIGPTRWSLEDIVAKLISGDAFRDCVGLVVNDENAKGSRRWRVFLVFRPHKP